MTRDIGHHRARRTETHVGPATPGKSHPCDVPSMTVEMILIREPPVGSSTAGSCPTVDADWA